MKKYMYGVLAVGVLLGGVYVYKRETLPKKPAAREIIKVGIMMPLSGDFGAVGDGIAKSAMLAIKDYEIAHPSVEVEFVEEDDKFDVKTGIAAYTKLTTLDHIDGLIMASTPVLDAEHEKMIEDKLPVMSVGLQNNGVADDNIFQLTPDPIAAVTYFAEQIQSKGNHKKLAIVHTTAIPAGASFYKAFSATYKKDSVDFTINSVTEARTLATKIQASGADAIVIMTMPSTGAELTKELLAHGVTPSKVTFYYDAQIGTGWADYKKQIGDMERLDGSRMLQFVTSDLTTFREKYKKEYGTDPAVYAEYGYDGITALLNAHDKNVKTWVDTIEKSNFMGYSGAMKFDSRGVRLQDTEIWTIKNGKPVKGE